MKTISWILLFGLFGLMGCGQTEPPKTVQESADQLPVAEFDPTAGSEQKNRPWMTFTQNLLMKLNRPSPLKRFRLH